MSLPTQFSRFIVVFQTLNGLNADGTVFFSIDRVKVLVKKG